MVATIKSLIKSIELNQNLISKLSVNIPKFTPAESIYTQLANKMDALSVPEIIDNTQTTQLILGALDEICNIEKDMTEQIKTLNKSHIKRDVLLVLFGSLAGVVLTIIASKFGWL